MNMIKPLAAAITLALASTSLMAMDKNTSIKNKTETGRPAFVKGDLGQAASGDHIAALKITLKNQASYRANGNEDFKIIREWTDKLGKSHTHVNQTINGLNVYGSSMIIHTNASVGVNLTDEKMSDIYAVSGKLAIHQGTKKSVNLQKSNANNALALASEIGDVKGQAELSYIYLPLTDETKLAWKIQVTWNNGANDFGDDILFIDAEKNTVLTRHAQMHRAKRWETDNLNNISEDTVNSRTPRGTLLCTNNEACGENSAQRAHDGASSVYDYYLNTFNRESVNNSGMTVVSGVHVGVQYNNAFWYNDRMWYGDGDGKLFNDLTLAHDVIAHELTHGVTEYTAGLIYQNASGALNEAWSDILGVSAESYKLGNTQPDWMLGEEVMAAGGALRYMNNPTQRGSSTDWYPDRIPFESRPTDLNDYGGVHSNSGIANLAFQLVVDGGSHPRDMSPEVVPSIGLAKAEQIFYRALSTYMTTSTDFDGARTATAQAAADLYGTEEVSAIESAWCAVGVGKCPTPPVENVVLENGVTAANQSASKDQVLRYTLEVPEGASALNFATLGGTGDADLYVKFGSAPEASASGSDCQSETSTSTENCDFNTPQAGTYHVLLSAWSTFSNVDLTGTYTVGSTTGGTQSESNLSINNKKWKYFNIEIPAGMSTFTVDTNGGTGDADLYIREGANPTTSLNACASETASNTETCTINNPAAGTWTVGIYGWAAVTGLNVDMEWKP